MLCSRNSRGTGSTSEKPLRFTQAGTSNDPPPPSSNHHLTIAAAADSAHLGGPASRQLHKPCHHQLPAALPAGPRSSRQQDRPDQTAFISMIITNTLHHQPKLWYAATHPVTLPVLSLTLAHLAIVLVDSPATPVSHTDISCWSPKHQHQLLIQPPMQLTWQLGHAQCQGAKSAARGRVSGVHT